MSMERLDLCVVLSLLTLLVSGSSAACNRDSLIPHRHPSHVLSSEELCPTNQQQTEIKKQIDEQINQQIDDLLPLVQASFSVSPCEGLGWRKVAHLDMTNSSQNCPEGWEQIVDMDTNKRLCGRRQPGTYCSAVQFATNGHKYSQVCGRIKAYQFGSTDGFEQYHHHQTPLDDNFVDGVVVTHGNSPNMEHVWTFAAGLLESASLNSQGSRVCPCAPEYAGTKPNFVGENFFCESGTNSIDEGRAELFLGDPLWDGEGCGLAGNTCCTYNNPPYFSTSLPQSTCDDLTVRICGSDSFEDVPVEQIELYVK